MESGGYSLAVVHGLLIAVASCCRARALDVWASVLAVCELGVCGAPAQLPGSTWDLPDPGMEPASPAWQVDSLPLNPLGSHGCNIVIHSC